MLLMTLSIVPMYNMCRMSTFDEYTSLIRELDQKGKVLVAKRHIEVDRAYREISEADVRYALKNRKVTQARIDDVIKWQGIDVNGRVIELLCRLYKTDGDSTLVIEEVEECSVETAYEPGVRDEDQRNNWLPLNPGWRVKVGTNGYVERISQKQKP